MHPCPGNWVEIGRAVVYYARADQAFSAGIKCRHCTVNLFVFDMSLYKTVQSLKHTIQYNSLQMHFRTNLPILSLLSYKAQRGIDLNPCHVGIHWIALAE